MFVCNKKVHIADKKNIYTIDDLGIVDPIPLGHESEMVIPGPNLEPCATPLLIAQAFKKRVSDAYFSDVTIEFYR